MLLPQNHTVNCLRSAQRALLLGLMLLVLGACNKEKDYYVPITPANVDSTLFVNCTWNVLNSTLSNQFLDSIEGLKDFDLGIKQIYFGRNTCVIKVGAQNKEYSGQYRIVRATNSMLYLYDIEQEGASNVTYGFTFREINVSGNYSAILVLSRFTANNLVATSGQGFGIVRIQRQQ